MCDIWRIKYCLQMVGTRNVEQCRARTGGQGEHGVHNMTVAEPLFEERGRPTFSLNM